MAKQKQEHIIQHQVINLEIEGVKKDSEIQNIQQAVAYFFKTRLGEELDRKLSKLAPPDVYVTLDNLVINLDNISFNNNTELERKLYAQLKEQVEKEVKKKLDKIEKQNRSKTKTAAKKVSRVSIFEHFVRYGTYPSWAGKENGGVQDIFKDLLQNQTKSVVRVIFKWKNSPMVRERLFQQFRKEDLELLVRKMYGSNSKAMNQLKLIKKRLGVHSEKAIISAAINYALEEGLENLGNIKERSFARKIVEEVQKRKVTINTDSKVRAGFKEDYSDIQILQYFLEFGAIPYWADVDSKGSFKELFANLMQTRLASVQRMVERNANNKRFVKRLIFQFETEDILLLLEPTPGENIRFITDSIADFEFLTNERKNINRKVGKHKVREVILAEALDYFFVKSKSRFIKQTFVQNVLVELASLSNTDYELLVKESYKAVRRKKKDTAIQTALEGLDDNLRQKLNKEKQELRQTQKEIKEIERSLNRLGKQLSAGDLSETEMTRLKKDQSRLVKKLSSLEKIVEGLADEDIPLEIEVVLQQRQLLQNQIQRTSIEEERQKIEKRLEFSDKEFQKLQSNLKKDLGQIIKDRDKLKEKGGSLSQKKLKRVENRLKKYQRAVQNIVVQLAKDEKDLELFLTDIRTALRQANTTEEKRKLRKERERIQKEIVSIRAYLVELKEQEEELNEQLKEEKIIEEIEEDVAPTRTSKLDFLIFFLKYGSTPWWADKFKNQTIEEVFLEFANESPSKLRKAFQTVGRYPVVWERVVNQLSENAIQEIIKKMYANESKAIFTQAQILFNIQYSQAFEKLTNVNPKKFKWQLILEYIMTTGTGFSAQKFTKDITIQTARNYRISSSRLVEYTYNIAQNNKGSDFEIFGTWAKGLQGDEDIAQADRELIARARQEKKKQAGMLLTNSQQMALLVEYLQTGQISDTAKDYKYNSAQDFENLLYEQIQKNKSTVRDTLRGLLRLSNTRNILIHQFSEDAIWEVSQLVNPSSVLPMMRYFSDFKKALGDKNLHLEKEVLLHFNLQKREKFETRDYLNALLLMLQQRTGRTPISILEDWKRKAKALKKPKSSFLVMLLAMEVELLRGEQLKMEDLEQRKTMQQQLEGLAIEYSNEAQKMIGILTEEMIEGEAIAERKYKLSEIKSLTVKLKEEIAKLEKKLDNVDALQGITLKRQMLKLKSQIKLLERERPPTLRMLEKQIAARQNRLKQAESKIEEEAAKNLVLEEINKAKETVASLVERQVTVFDLLKKEAPSALKLLPQLLEDLEDEDVTHDVFVKDIGQLTQQLKDEDYATSVLLILGEKTKEVAPVRVINKGDLGEKQADLLQKIGKVSPFELWRDWDSLKEYYDENKELQNQEEDKVQLEIYRQIKRRHQRNLLEYARTMHIEQQNLSEELEAATSLPALQAIEEKIDQIKEKQEKQVAEILTVAREKSIKEDFEKLETNLQQVFVKLKNKRIQKSNELITDAKEGLEQERNQARIEIEELEQQRSFVLDDIEKEEEPEKYAQIPKKKAKKEKTKPTPPTVPVDEPLQIYNAGMVLLWPYISKLFQFMKLVENKKFVDEEAQFKGIHLLQYLVTGKTEAPENELVLNKILCEVPLATPVPLAVEFTPQELQMAESLLIGAIKNWPKMKTMSPDAMRGTYLNREGTVIEEDDKWHVVVQKKTFDVLLKSLPWGFTFIRLPWLSKFISVEWPLI